MYAILLMWNSSHAVESIIAHGPAEKQDRYEIHKYIARNAWKLACLSLLYMDSVLG